MTENEQYGVIALGIMDDMYIDCAPLPAIFADLQIMDNNRTVFYYRNASYDSLYWIAETQEFLAVDTKGIYESCYISAWEMVVVVRE